MDWTWFHRLASPPHVYRLAVRLTPWFAWPAGVLIVAGLYGGLVLAPPDYQQGDGFRIIYVHAPSAWLSLMIYSVMASAAAVGLIWRMKVAHAVAASCAAVGAWFTVVSLVTGMLWGKPMWGTYWVWDPRLTAQLILLFLYLGYLALAAAEAERGGERKGAAILALVGAINLPIIKYSVEWWNTLHQGSSINIVEGKSAMAPEILTPLLVSVAGFTLLFAAIVLMRMRALLAEQRLDARSRRLAEAVA